MKLFLHSKFFLGYLAFLLFVPNHVIAGTSIQNDNKKLFLTAAIARELGDSESSLRPISSYAENDIFFLSTNFQKNYPWLYPYLYDVKVPAVLKINKWVKPVQISLGLPNGPYGEKNSSFDYYIQNKDKTEKLLKAENIIELQTQKLIGKLSDLTGLDIKYVSQEYVDDNSDISNIRIIVLDKVDWWETKYKQGNKSVSASLPDFHHSWLFLERHLDTKIRFTPHSKKQVSGYFISNENNSIEFAVCYIWSGHDEAMLKKLTQECLIRSLGFPNYYHADNRKAMSVLSSWNESALDSDQSSLTIRPNYREELSPDDEEFIRTLYLSDVKPGMSYADVFKMIN